MLNKIDKKLLVFVSSTYKDLKEERQKAVEAILRIGNIPSGMEYFIPNGKSTLDIIYNWIDDSDVFVLIIGGRYGDLDIESQKSYTHLEYEYAASKGKPIIAFVLNDDYVNEKVSVLKAEAIEREYPTKYRDFKNKILKEKLCYICNNSSEITSGVITSLSRLAISNDFIGWVSGKELDLLQTEISHLKEENEELSTKLDSFLSGNSRPYISSRIGKISTLEKSGFTVNQDDIEIQMHNLQATKTGFQLHFKVVNNSEYILNTPGTFKFNVKPEIYEYEINSSGYNITPYNKSSSVFVYPESTYEGYYEWFTNLEFEFERISYVATFQGGYTVPIRTWYQKELLQMKS